VVGELLFFTGPSDTVQGGDKVVHGKQGEHLALGSADEKSQ